MISMILTVSAIAESSGTNGTNGADDKVSSEAIGSEYTPAKQLELNQDPDRVLFA
jgi:hypothetical protein